MSKRLKGISYRSAWGNGSVIGLDPYATISWRKVDVELKSTSGETVFIQKGFEVPDFWTDQAALQVAQKYARGGLFPDGTPREGRETSVRQIINRVVDSIAGWAGFYLDKDEELEEWMAETGWEVYESNESRMAYKRPKTTTQPKNECYFQTRSSWQSWVYDLKSMLVYQIFSYNSPVWFNVGVDDHPQCSACFILRVEDYMAGPDKNSQFDLEDDGLLAAQVKEGLIFSRGSGSGINLSRIRSKREWLSGGKGRPTGPGSFSRGLDKWAEQIKSGGKTRRAAKMLVLDADHPDIREFIDVKAEEEQIARILGKHGYGTDMDSASYQHAYHQNSNLSVRVTDEFMEKALAGETWNLVSRTDHCLEDLPVGEKMIGGKGRVLETTPAKDLLRQIAQRAWECGDPGLHFRDQINRYHTCADTEPINASNPCSEYLFIDETSCNLASLNLVKVMEMERRFEFFVRAIAISMDVIVSGSRYPTPKIQRMSQYYRTLGMGYANLGSLFMLRGMPYDSDAARRLCSEITSRMTLEVYKTSAEIAKDVGPGKWFASNRDSAIKTLILHRDSAASMRLGRGSSDEWNVLLSSVINGKNPLRNAQATVIAPTGTISFMMDCDTTGIEPELALRKYKSYAGGGQNELSNYTADRALINMGYQRDFRLEFQRRIAAGESILTLPWQSHEHVEVFRTSLANKKVDKDFYLPPEAHLKMMAAAQPFLSGAISKTVNLPEDVTVDGIMDTYVKAWKMGLKAVAVYRDNCKLAQPLTTEKEVVEAKKPAATLLPSELELRVKSLEQQLNDWSQRGQRRVPPDIRETDGFKFDIDGHEGFMHVGFYEDRVTPCEIFIKFSKQGSSVQGLVDSFCIAFSFCLQWGVPFEKLLSKYEHNDFEPKGVTSDKDVAICRSVVDYVVRKMEVLIQRRKEQFAKDPAPEVVVAAPMKEPEPKAPAAKRTAGKTCRICGSTDVVLNRNCTFCNKCGSEDGGCFG